MVAPAARMRIAAIVGLVALGAGHGLDLAARQFPAAAWLDAAHVVALTVATVAALGVAVLVWARLPALLKQPSIDELLAANETLRDAAERRSEDVGRLAALKVELERKVSESAQALNEATQRFETALKSSDISMAQQDPDLRYVWVHNAPKGMSAATLLGRLQKDVLPPETHATLSAAKLGVMAWKEATSLEIDIAINGVTRQFHENIEPLWRDGEVIGVLTTCIETTAFRRRQDELRGLLRELTHRTKNLLAVIMGIARQSGRSAKDVSSFVSRFNGRIRALAITHELLVESEWRGVALRELILGIWRAENPDTMNDVALEGENLILTPESAQNLALAFHEMQGAALAKDGPPRARYKMRIAWSRSEAMREADVVLVWEGTGGAGSPIDERDDEFGKSFVEVLLPRATRGSSAVQAHDDGFTWTLTLPSTNFLA